MPPPLLPSDPAEAADPAMADDATADPADPAEPAETETEPVVPAADPTEPSDSETAQVRKFEDLIDLPQFIRADYDRFQDDRDYLTDTSLMDKDDEDTVSTNFILRNQYVLQSLLYARDPAVAIQPRPWVGPYPPGVFEFGTTCEVLGHVLVQEAGFRDSLMGMLQDVQTCSIAWLKVTPQYDFKKDPIGAARQDDQLDNIARLRYLLECYQAGSIVDDSAEFQEITDLSDTVRSYVIDRLQADLNSNPVQQVPGMSPDGQPAPMDDPTDQRPAQLQQVSQPGSQVPITALPEVPYFVGTNIDSVMPEDIRLDWTITRPEDVVNARWMAHRVFMGCDDIGAKWGVQADEFEGVKPYTPKARKGASSNNDEDPGRRDDATAGKQNDRYAVWELWHKPTGRRYVWVEGMKRFLVNEVPDVVWRKWFPFIPIIFNRITGKLIGVSDVRLQMPLQDEINLKRTHEREAQKSSYPRIIVQQGLFTDGEKRKVEEAQPYAVIEVARAIPDIKAGVYEMNVQTFNPILYDISKATREIEIMAGIPQQAAGGVGNAEFATEAAIANQQMGVQMERRRMLVEAVIHDVYECVLEYALQIMPEENVRQLVGPNAVWPAIDREHLWRMLNIEIKAGSSGKPDQDKTLQKWLQFGQLAQQLGVMVNGPEVFKQILHEMDLPVDLNRFIIPPAAAAMLGGGAPGLTPPPGAAPGGAAGAINTTRMPPPSAGAPGAPPMAARASAPHQQQVPNRPAAAVP